MKFKSDNLGLKDKTSVLYSIFICLFLSTPLCSMACPQQSDEKVMTYREYFNIDSHSISDSTSLLNFRVEVDSLVRTESLEKVSVTGYASIDGPGCLNDKLAYERAEAMKKWLGNSTNLDSDHILLNSRGEDWELFRNLVATDPNIPSKEKVLSIIDDNISEDTKDYRLKKLSDGSIWQYLAKNIFPKMRIAQVDLCVSSTEMVTGQESRKTDGLMRVDTIYELVEVEKLVYADNADCLSNRIALKTNLLYDVALMPSVEIEYKFNNRWSMALEGNIAWWSNDKKHKYYQIMTLVPEIKYHFNPDKSWQGHYLGLFAGGGKYDLENGGSGYKGEGGMLGLSYNYNWNINNNFGIEVGVGVGGLFTRYKKYIPKNGEYVYQKTMNLWYGGPLRVKLALVWKLWSNKCKGGAK